MKLTWQIPIILAVVFFVLKAIQNRNSSSSFNLFVVFTSITIYVTFQLILYEFIFSKLPSQVALNTFKDVIGLDPSGKLDKIVKEQITKDAVTQADYDKVIKDMNSSNRSKLIHQLGLWWVIALAAFSLISSGFIIKEALSHEFKFSISHVVVCAILLAIFSVEILIYYGVFKPYVFLLKSDLLKASINAGKSSIVDKLIGSWNQTESLRSSLDNSQNLMNQIQPIINRLTDANLTIQDISFDKTNQSLIDSVEMLKSAIDDISHELMTFSEHPCPAGDVSLNKLAAGIHAPDIETPFSALTKSADALQKYLSTTEFSRTDIKLQIENAIANIKATYDVIQTFVSQSHCKLRSQTRQKLLDLKEDRVLLCSNPSDQLTFMSRLKSNWLILLILLLSAIVAILVGTRMSAHNHNFDLICLISVFISLAIFQICFISFVKSGGYQTLLSLDTKYFLFETVS